MRRRLMKNLWALSASKYLKNVFFQETFHSLSIPLFLIISFINA